MSKKLTEAPTVKVGSASTSSTEACRDSSIPSYIGWMFLSESCTNSASWCSTACTVKRLSTSWNCSNQLQVSHHGNIFDPPPNGSWSYCATGSAATADGLSVWLIHRSGIPLLAWTVSDSLWRCLKTVSDSLWRCFCLRRIQRIGGFTTMRYINLYFTYLLLRNLTMRVG